MLREIEKRYLKRVLQQGRERINRIHEPLEEKDKDYFMLSRVLVLESKEKIDLIENQTFVDEMFIQRIMGYVNEINKVEEIVQPK